MFSVRPSLWKSKILPQVLLLGTAVTVTSLLWAYSAEKSSDPAKEAWCTASLDVCVFIRLIARHRRARARAMTNAVAIFRLFWFFWFFIMTPTPFVNRISSVAQTSYSRRIRTYLKAIVSHSAGQRQNGVDSAGLAAELEGRVHLAIICPRRPG